MDQVRGLPLLAFPVAAFLVAASGCGGSDTGSATQPPSAPALFPITQGSVFEELEIRWSPQARVDGYEAQGRLDGGDWVAIGERIPPTTVGIRLTLSSSTPEVTTFGFRVRVIRAGVPGEWSAEASFRRGPRWPVGTGAEIAVDGIRITWTNVSGVATSVRIYRRDPTASSAAIVLAERPATDSAFTDTGPFTPNVPFAYELAAVAGAEESVRVGPPTLGYPLVPVADLTATSEPAGIHLRWRRPPFLAQTFVVHRTRGFLPTVPIYGPVTLSPIDAEEYLDHPSVAGAFEYAVETWIGGTSAGTRSRVLAFATPAGSPRFVPEIRILPDGADVARDSIGRLAFALAPPSPGSVSAGRVAFSGTGMPADHDLGNATAWAIPVVAFDAQDRPHALLLGTAGVSGLAPVLHAWYDGSAWQEEEIARRVFVNAEVRFAVDTTGNLHAAWTSLGPPSVAEYARHGPAGWMVEDLGTAIALPATLAGLAIDGTGAAAVLARDAGALRLLVRDSASGTWSPRTPTDGSTVIAPLDVGWELARIGSVGPVGNEQGALLVQPWTASGPGVEEVAYRSMSMYPLARFGFVARHAPERQLAWVADARPRLALAVRTGGTWAQQEIDEDCRVVLPWLDSTGRAHVLCETWHRPSLSSIERFWVELTER